MLTSPLPRKTIAAKDRKERKEEASSEGLSLRSLCSFAAILILDARPRV
jgi:hypothetical protein